MKIEGLFQHIALLHTFMKDVHIVKYALTRVKSPELMQRVTAELCLVLILKSLKRKLKKTH